MTVRRPRPIASAVLATLVLSGCSMTRHTAPPPDVVIGSPEADPTAEAFLRQQSLDIAARWDARIVTAARKPVYAPTYGVELFDDNGELLNGRPMVLDAAVPFELPSPAVLRWPDGTTRPVNALTATQAFKRIYDFAQHPGCECPTAHATGARLISRDLDAVGGPVTASAWEFTFTSGARVVVPAVDPDEILLPPDPSGRSGYAIVAQRAHSTMDGHVLNVEFFGEPGGTGSACETRYSLEPAYSQHAVIAIIHEAVPAACRNIVRPMSAYARQISVTLPEPIGDRVVLDAQDGRLVPTVRS